MPIIRRHIVNIRCAFLAILFLSVATTVLATTFTVSVSSRDAGTYAGYFVRAGQSVTILATGTWHVREGSHESTSAAGVPPLRNGCLFGSLYAQIGFEESSVHHCIGLGATIAAERSGLLYLVPNAGLTNLDRNDGTLSVQISTDASAAQAIEKATIATYDFTSLAAAGVEWVELAGKNVLLPVPLANVQTNPAQAQAALERFDQIYALERELAGAVPFF